MATSVFYLEMRFASYLVEGPESPAAAAISSSSEVQVMDTLSSLLILHSREHFLWGRGSWVLSKSSNLLRVLVVGRTSRALATLRASLKEG